MKRVAFAALALFALGSLLLRAQSITLSPPPYLLATNNSGAIINNACIWTFNAGTTTPVTTYSDSVSTPNTNPIRSDSAGRFVAFLSPGQAYKFTYETACTPPAHGTVLKTVDGILGTPGSTSGGDITGIVGQTVTAGQVVYLSDGTGGGTVAGHWYLADNTAQYSSVGVEIGIVPAGITSGGSGTIRLLGYVTGLSGLTPGQGYYIGATGNLTATPAGSFKRRVGTADTTTTLVLTNPAASLSPVLILNQAVNVTVANTTVATTIYSFSVPGGTLATYRQLRLTLTGYYLNNNGSLTTSSLQFRGSYGGQQFLGSVFTSAASPQSGFWRLTSYLTANASTASQVEMHEISMDGTTNANAGQTPRGASVYTGGTVPAGLLTVNSTTAQTLLVTFQHGFADVNTTLTMQSATLEVIGQ